MKALIRLFVLLVVGTFSLSLSGGAMAFDEQAAKTLAKRNDCFRCHAVDKTKKGPSYKKIAEKYRNKADAEAKIIDNITKLHKVKLEDGTEEDHKVIDTKVRTELVNLSNWIRAQ